MSQKRVEFRTFDGTLLRGDYFPVEKGNAPIMVMTQGLSLLKECYIDDIARRFQKAGIAALVYDHRGWGSSEGMPYQETNPLQQAEDYHDAVTFVRTLAPAIDPNRVGIWGIGHSGGASIIAAGDDPRIKTAVFDMPWTSGREDAKTFPVGGLEEALMEREEHINQPNSRRTYIPVWDDTEEQAKSEAGTNAAGRKPWLHGEVFYKFITGGIARSSAARTPWENRLTLQSLYHISRVEPRDYIHKIEAPRSFLYMVAETDVLTGTPEYHKGVFALSKNPNARFVQTGKDHPDNYFGSFEESIEAQLRFLREFL